MVPSNIYQPFPIKPNKTLRTLSCLGRSCNAWLGRSYAWPCQRQNFHSLDLKIYWYSQKWPTANSHVCFFFWVLWKTPKKNFLGVDSLATFDGKKQLNLINLMKPTHNALDGLAGLKFEVPSKQNSLVMLVFQSICLWWEVPNSRPTSTFQSLKNKCSLRIATVSSVHQKVVTFHFLHPGKTILHPHLIEW